VTVPTFNQSKPDDAEAPAQVYHPTAEDRAQMKRDAAVHGISGDVVDACLAAGIQATGRADALRQIHAQFKAAQAEAPKPYVSNWPELKPAPDKPQAYAITYENGYAVQLMLTRPEVIAKVIHDGMASGQAHVAISGMHPLLFSLRGLRDFRAAAPGEFPANGPAQYAADMVVAGVIGGRAASVEIPVTMPDRKSETEVVRNPQTGEIERSVTIEKTVPNGA
jgi:hypothetical protein